MSISAASATWATYQPLTLRWMTAKETNFNERQLYGRICGAVDLALRHSQVIHNDYNEKEGDAEEESGSEEKDEIEAGGLEDDTTNREEDDTTNFV
jgi:hypothetical protein